LYRRQRSGFDRVPFAQICDVDHEGVRQRALLCNLSILGAYVHTPTPPPRDSQVMLSFRLPDDGPVVLAGATVTWVNDKPVDSATDLPSGFGVRFLSAAPDDLRRIATLVASYLAAPHPQFQFGVGMPPSGKARIPFVSPCVFFSESGESRGSLCNLSTLGAYATFERIPEKGELGRLRFGVPGLAGDFEVDAVVAWVNPDQPKRMLALPTGCGLRFENLSPIDEAIVTTVVEGYLGKDASERGVEDRASQVAPEA